MERLSAPLTAPDPDPEEVGSAGVSPPTPRAMACGEGSTAIQEVEADWWPLHLHWQGEADPVQSRLADMDPLLRLLLLGDGLTTRSLAAVIQEPIQAHLLEMGVVDGAAEEKTVPPSMACLARDLRRLGSPLMRRRVWLSGATSQQPLLYASSWWNPDHLAQHLPNPENPIGQNLIQERLETFRQLGKLYWGYGDPIAQVLGCPGPFWGRHYLLLHQGQPLTLIYEVFSPRLSAYALQRSTAAVTKAAPWALAERR